MDKYIYDILTAHSSGVWAYDLSSPSEFDKMHSDSRGRLSHECVIALRALSLQAEYQIDKRKDVKKIEYDNGYNIMVRYSPHFNHSCVTQADLT